MNELIETAFAGFVVDGQSIPVSFLRYEGHGEPYITYQQTDADSSFSGDDGLLGYVDYYDVDVYSRSNYYPIIERVKEIMKQNGFVWQPSLSSGDLYEDETGYYHKTLSFAYMREEEENG